MPQPPPCAHVALWLGFWGWKGAEGWGGAKISPGSFFSRLRLERGSQKLTAVQGQVARGRGRPIEYCSVQEVDGGLGVNDLEDLAEQGAQLLRRHLGEGEGKGEACGAALCPTSRISASTPGSSTSPPPPVRFEADSGVVGDFFGALLCSPWPAPPSSKPPRAPRRSPTASPTSAPWSSRRRGSGWGRCRGPELRETRGDVTGSRFLTPPSISAVISRAQTASGSQQQDQSPVIWLFVRPPALPLPSQGL